jgi:hypothetical protein
MKHFPERWQTTTQAARRAPAEAFEMPPGFATRVLARWKEAPEESLMEVMILFSKRLLMVSAVLFILSTALAAMQVDVTELAPSWIDTPLTARLLLP